MSDKCQGLFGCILGHHFKPVFEQNAVPLTSLKTTGSGSAEDMAILFRSVAGSRHVHTICSRCGTKIEEVK